MNCPHCGAPLTAIVDPFCPECRNALDEPPEKALPGDSSQNPQQQRRSVQAVWWQVIGLLLIVTALLVLLQTGSLASWVILIVGLLILAEGTRRAFEKR